MEREKLPLGITIGDVNGIGPELLVNVISSDELLNHCIPVIYTPEGVLDFYAARLEIDLPALNVVTQQSDIAEGQVNLRICGDAEVEPSPGKASVETGALAMQAIEMAKADVLNGWIKNVVTGPIDKKTIQEAGFNFPGHTEYFANAFETDDYMMLLCSDELIIGTLTGHVPVSDIANHISQEKIESRIQILNETLKTDFLVEKPKIAVLGLNPHAGDQGAIGKEELDIIKPAIAECRSNDLIVFGPFSSDGFFGSKAYQNYDAVLAMYHDQALIPFKQISFDEGVNYTAGLPIIRTSPDHGTAYDIAGKGIGSTASFVNAIFMVNRLYRNRITYYDAHKNPLGYTKFKKERFSIGVPDLK
jgi:4-hydroxythreonine-4-phosphate dehydrogenase